MDQSLDEIKLLKYVNDQDPNDEHGILQLYDYFYYKVRWPQNCHVCFDMVSCICTTLTISAAGAGAPLPGVRVAARQPVRIPEVQPRAWARALLHIAASPVHCPAGNVGHSRPPNCLNCLIQHCASLGSCLSTCNGNGLVGLGHQSCRCFAAWRSCTRWT